MYSCSLIGIFLPVNVDSVVISRIYYIKHIVRKDNLLIKKEILSILANRVVKNDFSSSATIMFLIKTGSEFDPVFIAPEN